MKAVELAVSQKDCWRKIVIALTTGVLSVTAFHEKAGRSQVGFFVFSFSKVFSFQPSRHCRHPSIRTLR